MSSNLFKFGFSSDKKKDDNTEKRRQHEPKEEGCFKETQLSQKTKLGPSLDQRQKVSASRKIVHRTLHSQPSHGAQRQETVSSVTQDGHKVAKSGHKSNKVVKSKSDHEVKSETESFTVFKSKPVSRVVGNVDTKAGITTILKTETKPGTIIKTKTTVKSEPLSSMVKNSAPKSRVTAKRGRQKMSLNKSAAKTKIKEEKTPNRCGSGVRSGRCPVCQMPFSLLSMVQSTSWHVDECLDQPYTSNEECPHGENCIIEIASHYKRFRHTLLARSSRKKRDQALASKGKIQLAKKELDFNETKTSKLPLIVPECSVQCVVEIDTSSDSLNSEEKSTSNRMDSSMDEMYVTSQESSQKTNTRKVKKRSLDEMFVPSDEENDVKHSAKSSKYSFQKNLKYTSEECSKDKKPARREDVRLGVSKSFNREADCLEEVLELSSDSGSSGEDSVLDINSITDDTRDLSDMLRDAMEDDANCKNADTEASTDVPDMPGIAVADYTAKDGALAELSNTSESSNDWEILRCTLTQQVFPYSGKKSVEVSDEICKKGKTVENQGQAVNCHNKLQKCVTSHDLGNHDINDAHTSTVKSTNAADAASDVAKPRNTARKHTGFFARKMAQSKLSAPSKDMLDTSKALNDEVHADGSQPVCGQKVNRGTDMNGNNLSVDSMCRVNQSTFSDEQGEITAKKNMLISNSSSVTTHNTSTEEDNPLTLNVCRNKTQPNLQKKALSNISRMQASDHFSERISIHSESSQEEEYARNVNGKKCCIGCAERPACQNNKTKNYGATADWVCSTMCDSCETNTGSYDANDEDCEPGYGTCDTNIRSCDTNSENTVSETCTQGEACDENSPVCSGYGSVVEQLPGGFILESENADAALDENTEAAFDCNNVENDIDLDEMGGMNVCEPDRLDSVNPAVGTYVEVIMDRVTKITKNAADILMASSRLLFGKQKASATKSVGNPSAKNTPRNVNDVLMANRSAAKSNLSKAVAAAQNVQHIANTGTMESSVRPNRKCPFYKKIAGTSFTMDAFNYGSITDCTAYFLSHFHYDHYGGLTKDFPHHIYCSAVTANLVATKIRVPRNQLHPLPLNIPKVIDGVEVTFLEANHCPGAVLILFKLKTGQIYLHTGDFRAVASMEMYPALQNIKVHTLYLDTTYCDPQYDFPGQGEVIQYAVRLAVKAVTEHPATLIVCGTYTIGKERIFTAIAEALQCKICVTRDKKSVLDCLEDRDMQKRLSLNWDHSQLHVLPMAKLNVKGLREHLEKHGQKYDRVLGIEPTGWTYSKKLVSLDAIRPKLSSDNITVYGVPYSEHSSYLEMKRFVQFIRPLKILPTVNNGNPHSRRKMEVIFEAWMQETRTGAT